MEAAMEVGRADWAKWSDQDQDKQQLDRMMETHATK